MLVRTLALALALALLGACGGGGGGGGSSTPPVTTVSGTVAANVPIPSYTIVVASSTGPTSAMSASGFSGPDGRYTATSVLPAPPFFIGASPGVVEVSPGVFQSQDQIQYPRLTSLAHRGGTANATPLTSLVVARLLGRRPEPGSDLQSAFDLRTRSETDVATAEQQVIAYLLNRPNPDNGNTTTPVVVAPVTNFVSTPFNAVPGDPYFEALKRLHASLMDSETIQGVEEHMLFGSDAAADPRSMLAFDFIADCTAPGTNNTRIILTPSAITIGGVSLPFQSGDQLEIDALQNLLVRWSFTFAASNSRVELAIRSGRLDTVLLQAPANGTQCRPQSEVLVAGKHPSMIGLIRFFAQAVNPAFSCTSSPFPGFAVGPNALAIEANSALRINDAAGPGAPALHLPSFNLHIVAPITVALEVVQPLKPAVFRADRIFNGGFDNLGITMDSFGQITTLSLQRKTPQSDQSQTCGAI